MVETPHSPPCRICHQPFLGYPMGEKNGYKFSACRACGSVLTEPWPAQEDIDRFFGDIQPEIVHRANPQNEILHAAKTIKKIMPASSKKRFLDITCRQGYAVMAAKELGFQARGIDSHDFFVSFAKDKYDANLFEHASVRDYAARNEQADFIFSDESFCEQPDPDGYTAALSKILAPKGILYIREPDGNHFRLPRDFPRWGFADPPLNFSYISKKGMESLLSRHGLKIQKSFFTWDPFMKLIVVRK